MRPRDRAALLATLLLAALALVAARPAGADDALWTLLKNGRQIVFVRHAVTTAGVGDPPGFKLNDCATQRNLTETGRADARRLGEVFRGHAVPVGRVLSSPWCRCLETARLAFGGDAEVSRPLSNLYGRSEASARQVREMETLIATWRPEGAGGNLVMVSHGSNILALTGISVEPAEMVVLTPHAGERFKIAGRLSAR
ncbi:MAG TPA: histidine phosphatase family protein [Methylomirabilota bacterium]|nr:histidine phosphatase family protein [Methylomirabilota bacterium]